MILEKYSFGCGDRFGQEASAQLKAYEMIRKDGVEVVPVWNKSNREHEIIGTVPASVQEAAAEAVEKAGWPYGWYVDADHINLNTVDRYLDSSDFFTFDVADGIGGPLDEEVLADFLRRHSSMIATDIEIPGLAASINVGMGRVEEIARKYLPAVKNAGKIYRRVLNAKGEGNFISEVSIDETDQPQGPEELLFILAAIADMGIPVQTIAPRFSGRFNKGVEYVGNPKDFAREFDADLYVVAYAIERFNMPENLKLSIHSGSDKFAIYPEIGRLIREHDAGIHVKTAGTNWLEEVIGLAEAGGTGLHLAKAVYTESFSQKDALCAPYAEVIDIAEDRLPSPSMVQAWSAEEFVRALRHDTSDELYNADFRQLVHVGYKVAAKMGRKYIDVLTEHRESVVRNVTFNLYERHMRRLFIT